MSRWDRSGKRSSRRLVVDTSEEPEEESYDDESTRPETGAYVPPTLDKMDSQGYEEGDYYVPPRKEKSLTGNISSLFRRSENSSATPKGGASSSRRRKVEDPTSPSAAAPPTPRRSPPSPGTATAAKAAASPRGTSATVESAKSSFTPSSRSSSNNKNDNPRRIKTSAADSIARGGAKKLLRSEGSTSSRLFYSEHGDDSSEDSDESRAQQTQGEAATVADSTTYGGTTVTGETTTISGDTSGDGTGATGAGGIGTILRYRGFSTSIQNLFLDEALVCASMGCFGLILSNRTEYLLQLRNDRRGVRWGRSTSRRTLPSRIVAYALLLTFILVSSTFVIWGFGSGHESTGFAQGFYDGYDTRNNNGQDDAYATDDGEQEDQDDEDEDEDQEEEGEEQQNDDANNYNYNYNNDDQQQQQQYQDDQVQGDDGGNNRWWNYNNNNNRYNNNNNNYGYNNNYNGDDANAVANGDDANAGGDDDYYQYNGDDGNANGGGWWNYNNYNNNNQNNYNGNDNNYNQNNYNGNNKNQNYNGNNNYNGNGNNQNYYGNNNNQNYNGYNNNGNNYNGNYGYNNNGYYNNNGNRMLDHTKAKTKRTKQKSSAKVQTLLASSSKPSLQCPHHANGIFKIRDMHEGLWEPAIEFLKDEWYRDGLEDSTAELRSLKQNRYAAYNGSQGDSSRDLASDLRVSFIIAFLIVLGVLGRRRRMRTRYYLVRARAQEDHLFYASSAAGVKRVAFQDSREDQYEGACSHTLCGCYPIDPPMEGDEIDDDVKVDDDGVSQRKKTPYHHDCVSRGFSCLMGCCCGLICRCWFQCMSICALAQEAREIRLLVPTRYQRVDYITHQPFHEYQKNVNDLRRGWLGKSRKKGGIMPHFHALSRLSRYTLAWFLLCFIVITATLFLNPKASFNWPDMVILIATFAQSFILLYLVHWIFHKSDLSLDAVIKFFAAGFLIAVPAAFFFEGLLVNIVLTIAYVAYAIGVKISDAFTIWVVDHYRILWIFSEMFNAYIVAAITEELCKYYTFRCVEHPDLIFLTGLAKSSEDERAVQGGIVKYPFSSHQVQNTNKRRDSAYEDEDERSVSSRVSHRSTRGRKDGAEELNPETPEEDFEEDENDVRTVRQKAAAVTTAMISTAVGLACAENFLYVFLLGGSEANSGSDHSGGVIEEWIVLLFRSLFPVHALAAAIQSIYVIRKYVECDTVNSHRIGVGRIIFPAALMHGSFDAVLLAINIFIETSWDTYLEKNEGNFNPDDPPYNPLIVNLVAWCSIVSIMGLGLFWYYRENRLQKQRLIVLEEKEKATLDANMAYRNPDESKNATHISELELV